MTAEPVDPKATATGHSGRLYDREQTVGPADVDAGGGVHLDSLARWIQDVAFLDLLDAELPESSAWIVRRTTIWIVRRPRFAERLRLSTFCSALARSVAERRTLIAGTQGALVEATAHWVRVDPETRMPARFSAEFLDLYGPSAGDRRARSRLRHPAPPPEAVRSEWHFRAADIDLAGHVNNAVYWQIAEQYLDAAPSGGGTPRTDSGVEMEIEFRGGAGAGRATVLQAGPMVWILDHEGSVAASIVAAPRPAPAAGESAKIRK